MWSPQSGHSMGKSMTSSDDIQVLDAVAAGCLLP
jgi:hypothetical protein